MTCCAPGADSAARNGSGPSPDEIRLASRDLGDGLRQTDLSVPDVYCAACIGKVEGGLSKLAGVDYVRLNLSTRRVSVKWRGDAPPALIETLGEAGYKAHLFEAGDDKGDPQLTRLIRALGVAGFCAMNIMLLSVSVWSGADAGTRHAFHWISAALALPALLYSGQIFFRSAWGALRHGRTNMDVPISIGICLAFGLSLYDTVHNGDHAYFDAATTLIFFLLCGRTLDHVMRERARQAVRGLMHLSPRGATVLREDGSRDYLPISEIEPGMTLLISAGDRIPVDARIESGQSDLDEAIATGESAPRHVMPGSVVQAGTLNLTGPLSLIATARADNSFLAEMVRLMEAAEGGRARYRRLADRAAQLYSPVVHLTALLTFVGWMIATGDWYHSISIAIAVLIITCPCALGLAVPIVQVIAARRLFENGIMVKDGSGLERLAEIDTVVFDKTGTLTMGAPRLRNAGTTDPAILGIAARLAEQSNHPMSRSIVAGLDDVMAPASPLTDVVEHPGLGIEARIGSKVYRLGRAAWAVGEDRPGTVLACDGRPLASFVFEDVLRPDAAATIGELKSAGLDVEILSGDHREAVAAAAKRLGIEDFAGSVLPGDKVARLETLATEGCNTLMVGDGLNDAPALAAAHVSMAPASAADIGRNAADFVFLHDSLGAVPLALRVSREAGKLIRQNFALAVVYNAIALPIAIAGLVTPLVAAIAMSLSSVIVVANALRLKSGKNRRHTDSPMAEHVSPDGMVAAR